MTKEILIAARALIAKPENWTQQYLARDSEGQCVDYASKEAICFCGIGAILKSARDVGWGISESGRVRAGFAAYISENTSYYGISDLNDQTSHEEVLAMFDKYIETLP